MFLIVAECPCCRDRAWHCESCWNKFHNGARDKDWVPPAYKGQPLFKRELIDSFNKMEEELKYGHTG